MKTNSFEICFFFFNKLTMLNTHALLKTSPFRMGGNYLYTQYQCMASCVTYLMLILVFCQLVFLLTIILVFSSFQWWNEKYSLTFLLAIKYLLSFLITQVSISNTTNMSSFNTTNMSSCMYSMCYKLIIIKSPLAPTGSNPRPPAFQTNMLNIEPKVWTLGPYALLI